MLSDKKSSNTIVSYSATLNGFIKYCSQRKDVDAKNIEENNFRVIIHEYLISLIEYEDTIQKKAVEYKASSLNNKRSCFRSFIKKLYTLDKISNDFSSTIEILNAEKGQQKRILSRDEVKRVGELLNSDIETAEKQQKYLKVRNKYMIWFFLLTGVRVSELTKVLKDDVNKERGEIFIRKSKGKKSRTIDMLQELKLMLYEYEGHIKKTKEAGYDIESPYLFSKYREPMKPMNPKTAYIIITDIMERAGINKKKDQNVQNNISPHNLRHTYASYGIDKSVNPAYLARQLGHSSPDVLYKVYTHEIDQKQREVEREKLEEAYHDVISY